MPGRGSGRIDLSELPDEREGVSLRCPHLDAIRILHSRVEFEARNGKALHAGFLALHPRHRYG